MPVEDPLVLELLSRRLQEAGAEVALRRREELRRREAGLAREHEEVRGRIPLWDRIVFFSRTADEARAGQLAAELAGVRAEIARIDGDLERTLGAAKREFPPFAIGAELEEIGRDVEAATDLRGVRRAAGRLTALADRVLATWSPDYDPERTAQALAGELTLRAAAGAAPSELGADPHLGVAPAAGRDLTALVARRLLDSGFLGDLARRDELRERCARLDTDARAAAARVTLGEKLNVFSDSPAEQERNRLAADQSRARHELDAWEGFARKRVHEALDAYPPLALYQRVVEAIAVSGTLAEVEEPTITPDGEFATGTMLRGRPLLLASLGRCVRAFHAAFPEVPLPSEAARNLAGAAPPPPPSPSDGVVGAALARIEKGEAPALLERALAAAAALGAIARHEGELNRGRPLLSRLGIWGDPGVDRTLAQLEELRARLDRQARALVDELSRAAAAAVADLAPFRVREAISQALFRCRKIDTDTAESSVPHSCPVYEREETLDALEAAREVLAGEYGATGDESALLAAAAEADARDPGPLGDPERLFRKLTFQQTAALIAERLRGTGFEEAVRRYGAMTARLTDVRREQDEMQARISFWDRLNIFSTTPAEKRAGELRAEDAAVAQEAQEIWATVASLFGRGVETFPPVRLYFLLRSTAASVRAIHATSVSRTVHHRNRSFTSTDTYWSCRLHGRDAADAALREAAAYFVGSFGSLPGPEELLLRWVRERNCGAGG